MPAQKVKYHKKTAVALWNKLKQIHKNNLTIVCCIAPFIPPDHPDVPKILNLLIRNKFNEYHRYVITGTLLAKQSRRKIISFLKRMVSDKRGAIEISSVLVGILSALPRGSPKLAYLWQFFCEYVDSLTSSVMPDGVCSLMRPLFLFYDKGQPLDDTFADSTVKLLHTKGNFIVDILDAFSQKRLATSELADFFFNIGRYFDSTEDRVAFLSLLSERTDSKTDEAAKLLQDSILEMNNAPEVYAYDVRRVVIWLTDVRNREIWRQIGAPVIDLIDRIEDPQRKLNCLELVSPLVDPELEWRVCCIVDNTVRKL